MSLASRDVKAESLVENLVKKIKSSIQFGGKCLIGRYIDDIIPTRSDAKRIEELKRTSCILNTQLSI